MAATRHIAFLRAINVGGRTIRMEQLRPVFEDLGCRGVETFLASGNVIFETRSRSRPALEKAIEAALLSTFQYEICTFVRNEAEVAAIAAFPAFPAAAVREARALNVILMREPLSRAGVRRLEDLRSPVDDFRVRGCEVYWLCRKRQSETKFSNAVFEKALGVRATFRGINTLQRLAQRYAPEGREG